MRTFKKWFDNFLMLYKHEEVNEYHCERAWDARQEEVDYWKNEFEFSKSRMIGYRNKANEYRLAAEEWMKKYDELKNKYEPEILVTDDFSGCNNEFVFKIIKDKE